MMLREDLRDFVVGALALALMALVWLAGFLYAPVDANQGEVYRIIFLHVPSAFAAFASAFALLWFSVVGLRKRREQSLLWSRAICEVGLILTVLTLATGSIWGKPTWGTWWTWDARLTTTFMLALLFAGWLMLYSSMAPGPGRVRACAVLGILIAADVPVIYQSVNWWRTLHQPQSILRDGGSTMDPAILRTLLVGIVIQLVAGGVLAWIRGRNLALREEVERASFEQMRA